MKASVHGRARVAGLSVCLAIGLIAAGMGLCPAWAQQQQLTLPPAQAVPGPQGGGGATLELPAMPSPQGGSSLNLPQTAPQQGSELVLPPQQLRRQLGYKQVTVTVTNQQGGYVSGLDRNDFRLFVNGSQRQIAFFRQDQNTPVSIGIIVDTSGSMDVKLPQARAAIVQFLRNLNARDDIFLFAFSARPFLLQPFTTDHALVMARLPLLHAQGQTALFDAVLDGLLMVQHGRWDKKALLVITDGMDNSSATTLAQVIGEARSLNVLIYTIGIGDPNIGPSTGFSFGPFMLGGDIDRVDAATLRTLSTDTGAKMFLLRAVGDGALLQQDTESIARELQDQYTIGFVASDPTAGGYRSLRVEVPGRPGAKVRVRKGVEIGTRPESASAGGLP